MQRWLNYFNLFRATTENSWKNENSELRCCKITTPLSKTRSLSRATLQNGGSDVNYIKKNTHHDDKRVWVVVDRYKDDQFKVSRENAPTPPHEPATCPSCQQQYQKEKHLFFHRLKVQFGSFPGRPPLTPFTRNGCFRMKNKTNIDDAAKEALKVSSCSNTYSFPIRRSKSFAIDKQFTRSSSRAPSPGRRSLVSYSAVTHKSGMTHSTPESTDFDFQAMKPTEVNSRWATKRVRKGSRKEDTGKKSILS